MVTAPYLIPAIDPKQRALVLQEATAILTARRLDFDAIVVRGVSGLLVGPTLAGRLRKPIIVVRKALSHCHSHRIIEAGATTGRYVIVDDFVSSGQTVEAIRKQLYKAYPQLHPVALYLYRQDDGIPLEIIAPLEVWSRPALVESVGDHRRLVGYADLNCQAA